MSRTSQHRALVVRFHAVLVTMPRYSRWTVDQTQSYLARWGISDETVAAYLDQHERGGQLRLF